MRKYILFFLLLFVFCSSSIGYARFDILNIIKDTVEKKIEDEADDSTEKALKGEGEEEGQKNRQSGAESPKEIDTGKTNSSSAGDKERLQAWSKYDFVPGDQIIFQDDLMGEENGEFPSIWDLYKGNIEIAVYGDENVINFATLDLSSISSL